MRYGLIEGLTQKLFHRWSLWIMALSIMRNILKKCYQLQKVMEIKYLVKSGYSNRTVLERTNTSCLNNSAKTIFRILFPKNDGHSIVLMPESSKVEKNSN